MTKRYAETTSVTVEKSKAEIEKILTRYGADQYMSGWNNESATIGFRCNGRIIKFVLPIPDKRLREFTHSNRGIRSENVAYKQWEQACRQRWRALALCIKAKLEAVEAGITTFEDEFLAHIVLPNGGTVSQFLVPQLEAAYESSEMPKLLPLLEASA